MPPAGHDHRVRSDMASDQVGLAFLIQGRVLNANGKRWNGLTADLSGQRHHQAGIHAAAQISDHRYIRPQTAFNRTEHDGLKLVYQLLWTAFLFLAAIGKIDFPVGAIVD